MEHISFDGQTAIVTGAGTGLGRSHAIELAKRGANIIVNDIGGDVNGRGANANSAQGVVDEIRSTGGAAFAHNADVTDTSQVKDMVNQAIEAFGRIEILINNAGILRDKSFSKMPIDDFMSVLNVHLLGSVTCTKAVWEHMKTNQYGRIVMTSSSSGLYGSFGQSNYAAAKMGLVGLMNVLHLEGRKYNIRVNTLSPTAYTRMTEDIVPPQAGKLMTLESVTAALVLLASKNAPERTILCAGAGGYAVTKICETAGIYLPPDQQTAEHVAAALDQITDAYKQEEYVDGSSQTYKFLEKAAQHLKINLF